MILVLILAASPWDEITAIVAVAATLVAILTLLITQSWANFHKKLDVTTQFQEAYATLEKETTEVKSPDDADAWFRRYWHLQIREYEYWLQGYIRDEIYIYWMVCNKADIERPKTFVVYDSTTPPHKTPYSYRAGWDKVKDEVIFKRHPYCFVQFIERMLAAKQDETFGQCILETKKELSVGRAGLIAGLKP